MSTESSEKPLLLVVDDIPSNIQVLEEILSGAYRLKIATNGEKALQIASGDQQPDLILLDVMMPGMDGFEVCARLKQNEKTSKIPVIFVTAREEVVDEQKGFDVGAVDYIIKPVSPPLVEARVRAHLSLARALRDLEKQNTVLLEVGRLREQVERMSRHDLKSPLTAVLTIPALLKRRRDLPEEVLETIGIIEKSGYRMLELIQKSLDLFRIESGTYLLKPVPVDIFRISRQLFGEFQEPLAARNITPQLNLDGRKSGEDDEFIIQGEETLAYSMMANFFKNAMEASPEHSVISISANMEPIPAIVIHNQGVVPLEVRERFLQKFATAGKSGGTGLGGYSARLMAETMGGKVFFASGEVSGTTITISFPGSPAVSFPETSSRLERKQGPEEEKASSQSRLAQESLESISRLNVLVIDNNEMVSHTVRQILHGMGIRNVLTARDSGEAQRLVQTGTLPQLVICDLNLPDSTGMDFLAWFRKNPLFVATPFIMVAAESQSDQFNQAQAPGVSGFISKPFSPDRLTRMVEELVIQNNSAL